MLLDLIQSTRENLMVRCERDAEWNRKISKIMHDMCKSRLYIGMLVRLSVRKIAAMMLLSEEVSTCAIRACVSKRFFSLGWCMFDVIWGVTMSSRVNSFTCVRQEPVIIRMACVRHESSFHHGKSSEKAYMCASRADVRERWAHSDGACPMCFRFPIVSAHVTEV